MRMINPIATDPKKIVADKKAAGRSRVKAAAAALFHRRCVAFAATSFGIRCAREAAEVGEEALIGSLAEFFPGAAVKQFLTLAEMFMGEGGASPEEAELLMGMTPVYTVTGGDERPQGCELTGRASVAVRKWRGFEAEAVRLTTEWQSEWEKAKKIS